MSDLKMSECDKCKCIPELMDRRTGFFVRCQCEAGDNVTYGQSVSFLDHINIDGDDDLTNKLGIAAFESVPWDRLRQSAIDAWEAKQLIAKQQDRISRLEQYIENAGLTLPCDGAAYQVEWVDADEYLKVKIAKQQEQIDKYEVQKQVSTALAKQRVQLCKDKGLKIAKLCEDLISCANTLDSLVESGHVSSHPQVELDAMTEGMRYVAATAKG